MKTFTPNTVEENLLKQLIESNKRLERQVVEMREQLQMICAVFNPKPKTGKKTKKELQAEADARVEAEYNARILAKG